MKGLRLIDRVENITDELVKFLPLDLIEGITTQLPPWQFLLRICQFLPLDLIEGITTRGLPRPLWPGPGSFLPLDLIEGITTNSEGFPGLSDPGIFTFGPDWRDYDPDYPALSRGQLSSFLPLDLIEGITTRGLPRGPCSNGSHFYLWTWLKGLRRSARTARFHNLLRIFTFGPDWRDYDGRNQRSLASYEALFLPLDLIEGITTWTR